MRGCSPRNLNPEKAEGLSPERQAALEPLLGAIESLSEQIPEYDERIVCLARETYPEVALLKQVKGVGTLIALTYLTGGSTGCNENTRLAPSDESLTKECGWKGGDREFTPFRLQHG
ncbi:MAG TPA: hypothetical protein VEI01_25740 [Terriglobales bacterium]|nr:hypothetical protein [Terriglobales bacterium]